jgi:hypothetical protein
MTTKNYQAEDSNKNNCTSNSILNIYHASFYTNENLSNNKFMFRIRCSIISISIIEYHLFRRLRYIDIKNKESRLKIVQCKKICSQEENWNLQKICSKNLQLRRNLQSRKNLQSRFFYFTNAWKLIKSDCIVNTKKRELRSSSVFSFFR